MWHRRSAPLRTHSLRTLDGLHELHVAEYGAAGGAPVLYLHGGPGGGTPPDTPRLFDPDVFRLVTIDQRGCGRSVCADRLSGNTTDLLIADAEMVRSALGIERWGVVGSSYGALLTALYASRHAAHISWAVVHGAFLGTRSEVGWLYEDDGASRFYPSQWADLMVWRDAASASDGEAAEPATAANDPLAPPALVTRFFHALTAAAVGRAHPPPADAPTPTDALEAAAALTRWEDEMETLAPMPAPSDAAEVLANAQIAVHFFYHGCHLRQAGADGHAASAAAYVPDGIVPELRAAAAALAGVPCAIVHGRHDVVCPPRAAWRLHAAWPSSRLRIVEGAAHALFEKPMRAAVQAALAELVAAGQPAEAAGGGGGANKRRRSS
jgi:proline iminopeptidase